MKQKLSEQLGHCLNGDGCAICNYAETKSILSCRNLLQSAYEKIKHLEDLEEQGLLLKLPCKVEDTVYAYCSEFGILPYTVDCIVFDEKITYQCSSYSEPIGDCPSECLDEIEPDISDFCKTVFLTQAEAEEALKRTERDNAE